MSEAPDRIFVTPTLGKQLLGKHKNVLGLDAVEYVRADTHLIAAAPDLYEALEANVDAMDAFGITGGAMDAARTALAKARGENTNP